MMPSGHGDRDHARLKMINMTGLCEAAESSEVNGTKFCHSSDWVEDIFPERTVYTY